MVLKNAGILHGGINSSVNSLQNSIFRNDLA